jgi:hypothetical protein
MNLENVSILTARGSGSYAKITFADGSFYWFKRELSCCNNSFVPFNITRYIRVIYGTF